MIARNHLLLILVLLFPLSAQVAAAQEDSWQKIAPVGMTFTISMPAPALDASHMIEWNDQRGMVRVKFCESLVPGRRYLVGEFFKTPIDRFAGLANFDNFVAGIEYSFRTRHGEIPATVTFDRDIASADGGGKQYRVQIWQYHGVLRLLEKDNAFYLLMVLGADENDPDAQRFISSFATGAVNTSHESSGVTVKTPANAALFDKALRTEPPPPWLHPGLPISGGILNGKAVSLPVPQYPAAARAAGDSGEVAVDIIIDEQGNVIWAKASEGPETLREAAETSARKARFSPTKLTSQPIKVSGRVLYNFAIGP